MATKSQKSKIAERKHEELADFSQIAKDVLPITLEEEMEKSVLAYAYLTIEERAIPDARDGLKPVQRRVMYTMHESGNTPDKQHVKSARIVGTCMGVYHPHGDTAIYDSLVRMAQDFTLMTPLVDGRGNFGDRPGAGAASSRYTEARLSKPALLLTSELREKPVDFVPNYDQTTTQPAVLPAQFPVLTVNGVSGIAVGFATSMAPHNPDEVIDATRWLLTHPNADLEKLMTFVPGPDFPTGGIIIGKEGIEEAYRTGRGAITIRAPYRIEPLGRGRNSIVFYELPYIVNSDKIKEAINDNVKAGKIQGVSEVKDLSDRRNGIRFTVETKTGVNAEALVETLYKYSPLETSFNFNNIALVDGVPILLGLKEQLEIFIDHRIDVVIRRTQSRKDRKDKRLHIIEGMLKALANIDEVIRIIRAAADSATAQANLIKKFKIDEIQADYILSIPLRRLTKFDQIELNEEKIKLNDEVKELNIILTDEKVLRTLIGDELIETKKLLSQPRRSTILGVSLAEHLAETKKAAKTLSVEVADEPCFISLSARGGIIRSAKAPRNALATVTTTTRGRFILVTNKGRGFRVDALHVGEKAAAVSSVLPESLSKGEKVISLVPVTFEGSTVAGLAMGTKNGIVKVLAPNNWPKTLDEFDVIALAEGDEIIGIRWMEDNVGTIFSFVSEDSSLLAFKGESVRPQGSLTGAGVAGIKLSEGMKAIEFAVLIPDELENALVVTHTGDTGKVSKFSLFGIKGRAGAGMRSQRMTKLDSKDTLSFASVGANPALKDADGQEISLPDVDPRRDGAGKVFELPVK